MRHCHLLRRGRSASGLVVGAKRRRGRVDEIDFVPAASTLNIVLQFSRRRKGLANLLACSGAQLDHLDVFGGDVDWGLDALPATHHCLPDAVSRGLVGFQ